MTSPTNLKNELYAHLSDEVQQELANHEKTITVSPGASLVRCGIPSKHVVILNSGSAEISVPVSGQDLSLGLAEPGRVLALQSVLSGEAPPATITCKEECGVTLIPRDAFLSVLRKNPQIYLSIAKILSADLAAADRAIRTHKSRRKSRARMNGCKALPVV